VSINHTGNEQDTKAQVLTVALMRNEWMDG